jgi:3-oxoacyl-[acyl-carrier-protein] synthase II
VEAFVQGIGIVGVFGTGMEAFSSTLVTGLSETQVVTVQTPDGAKEMPAFLADTSGLEAFIEKKTLRRMDHYSRMALLGAYLALENAGTLNIDRRRLGIVVASGYGASRSTCAFLDSFIDGNDAFSSPTHFSNSVHNAAAANISITLGVTGPCLTVSQFEMSVPSALISAIEWLKEGRVEKVLFGAVDEYSDILGYCWHRFHGHQRGIVVDPFLFYEQTAILGEGAAFFLLSLEQETGTSYGRIEDVNTQCTDGFECPDADQTVFILGADGHKSWGQLYERYVTKNMRIASYTPLYGSFPTNMAFDMAAAFSSFRIGKIYAPPEGVSCPSSLNIIKEEQPLDVSKICCLKFASKGESGAITITHR